LSGELATGTVALDAPPDEPGGEIVGADASTQGVLRWLPVAAVVAAVIPVVVATVRALARGWIAIGDDGLLLLRTQDVATANHPLLGTWTSASLTAGRNLNNPGPLWYDLLAPFVRIAGPSVGFAIGVMAANVAAIVGAAVVARRIAGDRAMTLVALLSAGLAWSMGSELLFDAWQPHSMILPFWLVLVLAWGVATGDLVLLPWLVGVASLVVQTHLSFVYVTAAVGAAAVVVGLGWPAGRDDRRSPRRGPLLWSLGVAVLAWLQPVIDQIAGTGNLGTLLRSGGSSSQRIGFRLGARFVASVVAYPPWWGRPGFTDTIRSTGPIDSGPGIDIAEGNVVGLAAAVLGLVLVLGLLTAVVLVGFRRRARPTLAVGGLAAIAVLSSVVAVRLLPIGPLGLSPHTMRFLWPVSAFVLLALLLGVAEWAPVRRVAVPVAAGLTVLLAVLNLPTKASPLGPLADQSAGATAAALIDGLDDYRPAESVLFDPSTLRFAEPYSGPVLAALTRNGVDVRVEDEVMVHQLGERRRAGGDESQRLVLLEGTAARTPPPGARAVSLVEGLDAAELAELETLRPKVLALARRDGLFLNADGAAAAAGGRIPFQQTVLAPGDDPKDLEAAGWIGSLVAEDYLDLGGRGERTFRRYSELERRLATRTVGLFEIPIETAGSG
jgi:hypothetical protein